VHGWEGTVGLGQFEADVRLNPLIFQLLQKCRKNIKVSVHELFGKENAAAVFLLVVTMVLYSSKCPSLDTLVKRSQGCDDLFGGFKIDKAAFSDIDAAVESASPLHQTDLSPQHPVLPQRTRFSCNCARMHAI
jgi:hypothetical protein